MIRSSLLVALLICSPVYSQEKKKDVPRYLGTVGDVTVELVSAKLGTLSFVRKTVSGLRTIDAPGKYVAFKVEITNNGAKPIPYQPWHATRLSAIFTADNGRQLQAWVSGPVTWLEGGIPEPRKIAPKETISDVIAALAPSQSAAEINIALATKTFGIPDKTLHFTVPRNFFETKEQADEAIALDKQREQIRKDQEARAAAAAAKLTDGSMVTRANYDKIRVGMSFADVVRLIGTGKELSSSGRFKDYQWRGNGKRPVIVSITFRTESDAPAIRGDAPRAGTAAAIQRVQQFKDSMKISTTVYSKTISE